MTEKGKTSSNESHKQLSTKKSLLHTNISQLALIFHFLCTSFLLYLISFLLAKAPSIHPSIHSSIYPLPPMALRRRCRRHPGSMGSTKLIYIRFVVYVYVAFRAGLHMALVAKAQRVENFSPH
jgi:hypothetical protein